MLINTKSHPSPNTYRAQFEELLNVDKMSFGIVSATRPDTEGSPLWVDTTSLKANIYLSACPSYWDYVNRTDEETYGVDIEISTSLGSTVHVGTAESSDELSFHFDFKYTKTDPSTVTKTATGSTEVINLGHTHVVDITVSSEGLSWTRVTSKALVVSAGLYYADDYSGEVTLIGNAGRAVTVSYCSMLGDRDATLASLEEAFVAANTAKTGIKASLMNGVITVIGIDSNFGIALRGSDWLGMDSSSRVVVESGSCIMPLTGDKVTLNDDIALDVPTVNVAGKTLFVVLSQAYDNTETTQDVFGNETVKLVSVASAKHSISVDESFDPSKNNVCLAVIKPYTNGVTGEENATCLIRIDSNVEKFSYLRPWYSPVDYKHREYTGTGKVTHHNPHGISYNDIFAKSKTTLHDMLISRGALLCKPNEIQDACGITKTVKLMKLEALVDRDGSITGNKGYDVSRITTSRKSSGSLGVEFAKVICYACNRYFTLPNIPIEVIGITYEKNGVEKPINYNWIKGTSYIEVPFSEKLESVSVTYRYEPSLEPSITENGNDVELGELRSNCVVFSEGMSVDSYDRKVSFNKAIANKEYSIYLDRKGQVVSIPVIEARGDIEESSGEMLPLVAKSRIEVILDNIAGSETIECPTCPVVVSGSTDSEVEIFQTFALTKKNKYGTKYQVLESSLSKASYKTVVDKNSDNSLTVRCEPSRQQSTDYYLSVRDKDSELSDELSYVIEDGDIIYGGIEAYIELAGYESSTISITLSYWTPENGSRPIPDYYVARQIDSANYNGILGIHLNFSEFDGMSSVGYWQLHITGAGQYILYKSFRINYGVIEPNIYAKMKDGTILKLPMIDRGDGTYDTDIDSGSEATPRSWNDFLVKVNIIGSSNGEEITETMEFGPSFRNQSGMNSQMSANAFETVDRYAITEASHTGTITFLAHPVGNVGNMCEVFAARYGETKLSKVLDRRDIKQNLRCENKSTLYTGADLTKSLTAFCEEEELKPYFSFTNVGEDSILVTMYSSTQGLLKKEDGSETIIPSGGEGLTMAMLPNETFVTEGQSPCGDKSRPLIVVAGSSSAKVAVNHYNKDWTSLDYAFCDCSSLVSIPMSWEGLENITSMQGAFYGCVNLARIPMSWEGLEKVTDISKAFCECESLAGIPSSWEGLDSVVNMEWAFIKTCITEIKSWDHLPSLTNLNSTFAYCTKLSKIPSSWVGLELVFATCDAFLGCSSLESIPQSWDGLINVTTSRLMFSECSKLSAIPLNWGVLRKVDDVSGMFSLCKSLVDFPRSWKGLDSVVNASSMFEKCESLRNGGIDGYTSLSKVNNTENMFYGCGNYSEDVYELYTYLSEKDVSVASHNNCFTGNIKALGWDKVDIDWGGGALISDSDYVEFSNLLNETVSITVFSDSSCDVYCESEFVTSIRGGECVDIDVQPSKTYIAFGLRNCHTLGKPMFKLNSGKKSCLKISKWNASETNLSYAFENSGGCLAEIPRSWADCSKVKSLNHAFSGCVELKGIPSSWSGLGNVTDTSSAFSGCTGLTSIPNSWSGLGHVTSTDSMFSGTNIESIPSSFNGLGSVTSARYMFSDCSKIKELVESWSGMNSVTDIEGIFENCSSATSGAGSSIQQSLSKVTNCCSSFRGCSSWKGKSAYLIYQYLSTRTMNHYACFADCNGVDNIDEIPEDWGGSFEMPSEYFAVQASVPDNGVTLFRMYSKSAFKVYVNGLMSESTADGSEYYVDVSLSNGVAALATGITMPEAHSLIEGGAAGSLKITNWVKFSSLEGAFNGCQALAGVNTWEGLEKCTSFKMAFKDCTNLKSVSSDFSPLQSVTDYSEAFCGCSQLSLSLKSWSGFSSATDLSQVFSGTRISAIPDSWTGIKSGYPYPSLYRAFYGCTYLMTGGWQDVDKLRYVNMTEAFNGCTSYVENVYKINEEFSAMYLSERSNVFKDCTSADGYRILATTYGGLGTPYMEFENASGKDGYAMVKSARASSVYKNGEFVCDLPLSSSGDYYCAKFPTVNGDKYQLVGLEFNETVKRCMVLFGDYEQTIKLKGLRLLKFDTSISDYSYFMYNCVCLTEVASWEGVENVTSFKYAFAKCTALSKIPSSWSSMPNFTDALYMFGECTSLESIPSSWSGFSKVTNATGAFYKCSSLKAIPTSWSGLDNLVNTFYMFAGCSGMYQGGSSNIDALGSGEDGIKACSCMFQGCIKYTVSESLAQHIVQFFAKAFPIYVAYPSTLKALYQKAFDGIKNESSLKEKFVNKDWF